MNSIVKLQDIPTVFYELEIFGIRDEIIHIFSVPVENSVGTNDLDNSITLLKFKEGDPNIQYEQKSQDFLKYVSGGTLTYLPVFSQYIIGYAQTRRFILFNLNDSSFYKYAICNKPEETISNIAIVDSARMQFIFEIESFNDEKEEIFTPDIILRSVEINNGSFNILSELNIGEKNNTCDNIWIQREKYIFIYNYNENILKATDTKFNPQNHPLVSLFNEKECGIEKLRNFNLHPSLPLAILSGTGRANHRGYTVWYATWEKGEKPHIDPILKREKFTDFSDFDFSPDGKFMVFKKIKDNDSEFYLVYIDENRSNFLGNCILLGNVRNSRSTAWIEKPLSFVVVSADNKIWKWNLTKNLVPIK